MADIPNFRYTMELVWHSCSFNLPQEDYNDCIYVTNGKEVLSTTWKRDKKGWQRFETSGWYIEPGVNSDGWWWADLVQTVNGFSKIQDRT